jgi:hypothetical protein
VKGLTLHQPFATLIATGWKRMETRGWQTEYRGDLAIHAAKAMPLPGLHLAVSSPTWHRLLEAGYQSVTALPRGEVVAVVTLFDVVPASRAMPSAVERAYGDFSTGRYVWILEDVRRVQQPLPCLGARGVWPIAPDLEHDIRARL